MGYRTRKSKSWFSCEGWRGFEERRQLKGKVVGARSKRIRARLQEDYRKKDQEVERSLRKDKREWTNGVAHEAEDSAKLGQMKGVYDAARKLCFEQPKRNDTMRSKDGKLLTNEEEVQQWWKEHFTEVVNRPTPEQVANVPSNVVTVELISAGPISKAEIRSAITGMSCGKAPGKDNITVLRLNNNN